MFFRKTPSTPRGRDKPQEDGQALSVQAEDSPPPASWVQMSSLDKTGIEAPPNTPQGGDRRKGELPLTPSRSAVLGSTGYETPPRTPGENGLVYVGGGGTGDRASDTMTVFRLVSVAN